MVALAALVLQLVEWSPADALSIYSYPPGTILKDQQSYEYVVVGAGAAGSAVAARLALFGKDVLLVEAGGNPNLQTRIPLAAMSLLGSRQDWAYKTQPNNVSCLSSRGRQCRFSRGKCLGGSTSINYMIYTRGNRHDYDDFGIPDWSWEDLKPYFLRYEGLQILDQFPPSSKPYHNTRGIMKLEFFAKSQNPWRERLFEGYESIGFPFNADVNGVSQIGCTSCTGYVYGGERMSTARAYLTNTAVRQALKVAKFTYCTGVIINEQKVAVGVTVVQGNVTKTIYASKEVILCAGAIGTPVILMLSGIGPADHLKEMGISVVADLPVGKNMSDHVLPILIVRADGSVGADIIHGLKAGNVNESILSPSNGPLASNNLVEINVFANTSCYSPSLQRLDTGAGCDRPTMQIIQAYIPRAATTIAKSLFQNGVNFNDDVIDQVAQINAKYPIFVFSPINLTPFSQGYVKLRSSDPLDEPYIFPNYLGDDRDVDEMLRSIGIVETLMKSQTFKNNNAKLYHLKLPDCPSYEEDREEYWRCYIRHLTFSVYHAVGTCSMQTCVDTRLRVKGVQRLRVADLSIYPKLPRGNTAAPAIAAGERLVDFMLGTK